MPDFSKCFRSSEDHCFVDWEAVDGIIARQGGVDEPGEFFNHVAREWLLRMADAQVANTAVFETRNLLVMASRPGERQSELGKNFEKALEKVLSYLGRAAEFEKFGKLAVLVFDDPHSYSDYAARFYPEDSIVPMSGGVCLNNGYVHLAFYEEQFELLLSVFVHEVTHAYLGHQMLPLWMDEAIAMRMEGLVAGRPGCSLDRELFARHQSHWNHKTLALFKSGESWSVAGDSFELSYSLAEIIWRKIETNLKATPEEIQDLIIKSSPDDGGDAALQEIFGIRLSELFQSFLGEAL